MKLLKQRIREARVAHGWTQEDLAKRLGSSPAVISHYEAGQRVPSVVALLKLTAALCVSADWLLGLESHQQVVQCPMCAGKGVVVMTETERPGDVHLSKPTREPTGEEER